MSVINSIPLIAAGDDGYQISRSVRLRRSASAYFNRTPAGAGNQKTWTWSGWVKRGALATTYTYQYILGSYSGSSANETALNFGSNNELTFFSYASAYTINCSTSAVFRDPSAWYHIVLAVDTTQATNSNGVKLYVNGVQQTLTFSAYTQNTNTWVNGANVQLLSNNANLNSQLDGYLTETVMVDGQALTPSSFGETDLITGVWKPKKYAGTYGNNGFYLNFSDNSNNTAATIGKDYSGNGNNWTPNNISVTTGSTYDSMLDVPTMWADGGNGRGNYATLNPLMLNGATLSEANLKHTGTYGSGSTVAMKSGKWYCEFTCTAIGAASAWVGISDNIQGAGSSYPSNIAIYGNEFGDKYVNGSSASYGATWTTNDVIGCAYDADNNTITFYKNGTSQGTISSLTASTNGYYFFINGRSSTLVMAANFGQRPFSYTPPTGFKALNTQNLPDSTIKKGNQYFDVVLRTGTTATYTKTGLGFQPDLAWTKLRSTAYNHLIQDSVRGVAKQLNSDTTSAEQSISNAYTSFNSDGYTLGINTGVNESPYTYVDWLWKESVSAGFDIVTYTGTGVARTVSHSLGVTPSMIIVKDRTTGGTSWQVYHRSLGNTDAVLLNSTGATFASSSYWNNTSPTSSVFTVGTSSFANTNTEAYVAYLFSEVAGYSKFGSYTGNGSTDGPFVYCGFRPRYILVKCSSGVESWYTFDSARDIYNVTGNLLVPNQSLAESTFSSFDLLSNGFKIRTTNSLNNTNGATYIYAAFAENPFKNSLAR